MDIKELASIASSAYYQLTTGSTTSNSTNEDSTDDASSKSTTSMDSFISSILNSTEAIPSGIYTKDLTEVNVYGDTSNNSEAESDMGTTSSTSSTGSSSSDDDSSDEVTTEIVRGPDGSMYMRTTTTTADGETTVTMTKLGSMPRPEFGHPEQAPDDFNPFNLSGETSN